MRRMIPALLLPVCTMLKFVVKYNPQVVFQWKQTFAGSGIDNANGIAIMRDGSIVVCGLFHSSLTIQNYSITAFGEMDMFVARLGSCVFCDPTYIGANVGVMPSVYESQSPQVFE